MLKLACRSYVAYSFFPASCTKPIPCAFAKHGTPRLFLKLAKLAQIQRAWGGTVHGRLEICSWGGASAMSNVVREFVNERQVIPKDRSMLDRTCTCYLVVFVWRVRVRYAKRVPSDTVTLIELHGQLALRCRSLGGCSLLSSPTQARL